MEHGGALTARTCMLKTETTKSRCFDRSLQMNGSMQRGVIRLCQRCVGSNMGGQFPFSVSHDNMTPCAVADSADWLRKRCHLSLVVSHEIEVYRLGILHGADDAQAIARQCMCIEFEADIHILSGGTAKTLPCRLGGIDIKPHLHLAIVTRERCVHQSCSTLCLQESSADSTIETLAILPHRLVAVESPWKLLCVSRFISIDCPEALLDKRLPLAWEIMEVGLHHLRG